MINKQVRNVAEAVQGIRDGAMLLVGGLSALQQAAVLGSVPFTFVVVGVAVCWIKALREETATAAAPAPESLSVADDGVPVAATPDEEPSR